MVKVRVNIAVKTVDRSPRRNFLGDTLQNLKRAGVFDSEHLGEFTLVDSGSPNLSAFLRSQGAENLDERICVVTGKRTMHQNAARCIKQVSFGDARWGLVLEDDIDVCANFLKSVVMWLEEHELHGPQMYVFGANYSQIGTCQLQGHTSWAYPCTSFYGALACAWRREVAADVAEWLGPDPFFTNEDGEKDRFHGHDLLLGLWGREVGQSHFLCAVPNFIQHVGNESSLGNKVITYPAWPGREWSYA